jgi:hypothetical protein
MWIKAAMILSILIVINFIAWLVAVKDLKKRNFKTFELKQKAKRIIYYIPFIGPLVYLYLVFRKKF